MGAPVRDFLPQITWRRKTHAKSGPCLRTSWTPHVPSCLRLLSKALSLNNSSKNKQNETTMEAAKKKEHTGSIHNFQRIQKWALITRPACLRRCYLYRQPRFLPYRPPPPLISYRIHLSSALHVKNLLACSSMTLKVTRLMQVLKSWCCSISSSCHQPESSGLAKCGIILPL